MGTSLPFSRRGVLEPLCYLSCRRYPKGQQPGHRGSRPAKGTSRVRGVKSISRGWHEARWWCWQRRCLLLILPLSVETRANHTEHRCCFGEEEPLTRPAESRCRLCNRSVRNEPAPQSLSVRSRVRVRQLRVARFCKNDLRVSHGRGSVSRNHRRKQRWRQPPRRSHTREDSRPNSAARKDRSFVTGSDYYARERDHASKSE